MSAASWVELALIIGILGGLVIMCVVDPKGLVEAKYGKPEPGEEEVNNDG